jgi:hypothetical protein
LIFLKDVTFIDHSTLQLLEFRVGDKATPAPVAARAYQRTDRFFLVQALSAVDVPAGCRGPAQ